MESEELSSSSESTKLTIGVYPDPLVVEPKTKEHRQTVIILHGRGSNGPKFGPPLLGTRVGNTDRTLADTFPYAKFIFPTAAPRRAKIYRRTPIFQWMDNWSLDKPLHLQDLQVPGLQASTAYIHGLLQREIEAVGVDNVLLGGLSQGCACTLMSLLTWQGPKIPAAFGMCGWLPFAKTMTDAIDDDVDDDNNNEENPFAQDEDEQDEKTEAQGMVSALYEVLEMDEPSSLSTLSIPVFLGHGSLDTKVPTDCGRTAAKTLKRISVAEVKWEEYEGLAHWYSSDMLEDLVTFLKANTGSSWSS